MPKKTKTDVLKKHASEIEDLVKDLKKQNVPDVEFLESLAVYIHKNNGIPTVFTSKFQNYLLKPLNSEGFKYLNNLFPSSSDKLNFKAKYYIKSLSNTFTSIFFDTVRIKKEEYAVEFQKDLLYNLCDCLSILFDKQGLSDERIQALMSDFSESRTNFKSLEKIGANSSELMVYCRCEFFIQVLRTIMNNGSLFEMPFILPRYLRFFVTLFGEEITKTFKTSPLLINLYTQTMHCFHSMIVAFGITLMPAGPSIYIFLAYQLGWTEKWKEDSDIAQNISIFRLAIIRCLTDIVQVFHGIASYKYMELLPKVFDQISADMYKLSKLNMVDFNYANVSNEKAVEEKVKLRLLWANLNLIKNIFKYHPYLVKWPLRCSEDKELHKTIIRANKKLSITIALLIKHISKDLPTALSSLSQGFTADDLLLNPISLSLLSECCLLLGLGSDNSCCKVLIKSFINGLCEHQNINVAMFAIECRNSLSLAPLVCPSFDISNKVDQVITDVERAQVDDINSLDKEVENVSLTESERILLSQSTQTDIISEVEVAPSKKTSCIRANEKEIKTTKSKKRKADDKTNSDLTVDDSPKIGKKRKTLKIKKSSDVKSTVEDNMVEDNVIENGNVEKADNLEQPSLNMRPESSESDVEEASMSVKDILASFNPKFL